MSHWLFLMNVVFVFSSLLMVFCFFWAKQINNYSIVDAIWAFSFFAIALLMLWLADGWLPRKILMVAVVGSWSLRLGIFLASRIASHHPKEDNRYVMLRHRYGDSVEKGFFWFFQYQAWSVVLLSIPFVVMSMSFDAELQFLEILGAIIAVVSVLGEAIADAQKSAFKKKPENKGKNCEVGLWRYSRHPNYFFEACVWLGFYLMVFSSPGGKVCIFVPLLMWLLLLKVTGVPMSEESSKNVYGEAYLDYQRRVSIFIPWFPKK